MKKTTLIVISTVAIACMSSAWGLGINAGFSPKELTPELAVSIGAMNSSLSVSGSQGDVDAKLYKGDTDVFYFTELVTTTPTKGTPTLTCEDVTINVTGSSDNHYMRIMCGALNTTNTIINTGYLTITNGGSVNMDGGQLNLTGDRSDLAGNDSTYKISGAMNLHNVEFTAAGNVTAYTLSGSTGHIAFTGNTSFKGTSLIVQNSASISVLDNSTVELDSLNATNLIVSNDARVAVSSAGAIKVNSLTLLLNGSEPLDFADIFKTDDGTSIVFSAASTDITVADGEGNSYENVLFAYDDNGNITGIAAVPEPAALAAVLGALALAFAARRREK